jgi:hypothetical protein
MAEPKITIPEHVLAVLQGLAERGAGNCTRCAARWRQLEAAIARLRKDWLDDRSSRLG